MYHVLLYLGAAIPGPSHDSSVLGIRCSWVSPPMSLLHGVQPGAQIITELLLVSPSGPFLERMQ